MTWKRACGGDKLHDMASRGYRKPSVGGAYEEFRLRILPMSLSSPPDVSVWSNECLSASQHLLLWPSDASKSHPTSYKNRPLPTAQLDRRSDPTDIQPQLPLREEKGNWIQLGPRDCRASTGVTTLAFRDPMYPLPLYGNTSTSPLEPHDFGIP